MFPTTPTLPATSKPRCRPRGVIPLLRRAPDPVPEGHTSAALNEDQEQNPDAADAAFGTCGDRLPPLMPPAEVAAHFDRSTRTLRDWARRGVLVPLRINGSLFYRRDEVRALIEGRLERTIAPLVRDGSRAGASLAEPAAKAPAAHTPRNTQTAVSKRLSRRS